jgi:hypothetical protein
MPSAARNAAGWSGPPHPSMGFGDVVSCRSRWRGADRRGVGDTRALGGCREKLDALAKVEARGEKSVGRGGSIPKRGGGG